MAKRSKTSKELIGEFQITRASKLMTAEAPTFPKGDFESEHAYLGYAPWGDSDDLPNKILADIKLNTLIAPQLNKQAQRLYGGGIVAGSYQYEEGEQYFYAKDFPEFTEFAERSALAAVQIGLCKQAAIFYNAFAEFYLNEESTKITRLNVVKSKKCRLSLKNKRTGLSDYVWVNPDFGDGSYAVGNTEKVRCVEDWYNAGNKLREELKAKGDKNTKKFIMPLRLPGIDGGDYYELADWDVIRSSDWLDYSNDIIKYKKSILKNQVVIKYLIFVEPEVWTSKFPNWNDMKPEERQTEKQALVDDINQLLQGDDSAGLSMMFTKLRPHGMAESVQPITIVPVESKLQEGAFIEDSREGFSHITTALGVDESISGGAPGKQMGAGSGSDKRVAYNIAVSDMKAFQDILIRPLYFIRDFNQWPKEMVFANRATLISTLDTGGATKGTTSTPTEMASS